MAMEIVILNGDMEPGNSAFTRVLHKLASDLGKHHNIQLFDLAGMNLKPCTGCWSCWVKTPGLCPTKDDAELIFGAVINAGLLIFASPLMAGFTSSLLKRITDRLIVLIHPYLQIINGEHHHRKRYERYPDFGLVVSPEPDTDAEDLLIVKSIYDRLAINFHSRQRFFKVLEHNNFNAIINEARHIQRISA
jgi:hypothetical protein